MNSKKPIIGICGCGWLGTPLAVSLINDDYTVYGTTTSKDKIATLKSSNIHASQLIIDSNEIIGSIDTFLKTINVLIINIPPARKKYGSSSYDRRIKLLTDKAINHNINRILFISSTSVFENTLELPDYNENELPNATKAAGKDIINAEKVIKTCGIKNHIIRPGGLIGSDRHPVYFLAGKKDLSNPAAPVNLVERSYLIDLIKHTILHINTPTIQHAISVPVSNRKSYYTNEAINRNLEIPQFNSKPSSGKYITSLYNNDFQTAKACSGLKNTR